MKFERVLLIELYDIFAVDNVIGGLRARRFPDNQISTSRRISSWVSPSLDANALQDRQTRIVSEMVAVVTYGSYSHCSFGPLLPLRVCIGLAPTEASTAASVAILRPSNMMCAWFPPLAQDGAANSR